MQLGALRIYQTMEVYEVLLQAHRPTRPPTQVARGDAHRRGRAMRASFGSQALLLLATLLLSQQLTSARLSSGQRPCCNAPPLLARTSNAVQGRLCKLRGGHAARRGYPIMAYTAHRASSYSSPYESRYETSRAGALEIVITIVLGWAIFGLCVNAAKWICTAVCAGLEVVQTPGRILPYARAKLALKWHRFALRFKRAQYEELMEKQNALDAVAGERDALPAVREAQMLNKLATETARRDYLQAQADLTRAQTNVIKARCGQATTT